MSEDPIGFRSGDYNLYRYVGNQPTKHKDPFGLMVETCWAMEGSYPHNYICVDGVCGGQTPGEEIGKGTAFFGSTPGGNQGGPSSSEGGSCSTVPTWGDKHSQCMDNCAMQALAGGRPNYSIVGDGKSCSGFVNDTISSCTQKCATAGLK